jgi:RNA polymerase sigma-70 factor (ECF subfamily)
MEVRATTWWMGRAGTDGENDEQFAAILERAIAGDVSAFEQIVIRYERRVLTLAWRLLGKSEDAQDAAQEAFLRAYRFLHGFNRLKSFEPWLVRITVNVCRDFARKRQRHTTAPLDPEVSAGSRDPHGDLQTEERKTMLYRALDQLPAKERAAVVLRDLEGHTTAEVAQILGSSEATVRVQISNARLKIRKFLNRK